MDGDFDFWATAARAARKLAESDKEFWPQSWGDVELAFLRLMEKAPNRAA